MNLPLMTKAFLALSAAALLAGPALASGAPKAAEAEAPPAQPTASDHYVHQWIPVPAVAGSLLGGEGETRIAARKGRATVILFVASWCEPCQQLTPDFLKLVQRYRRLDVDFLLVFAHDTRDDAEGFMKEFGIGEAVLANQDVLKAYHNPELPTVYVGDRHGWLATRYTKTTPKDLAALDELLKHVTAL